MSTRTVGTVVIGSVAPFEREYARSHGHYLLPACPEGHPYTVLEIDDAVDRIDQGDAKYIPYRILAEDIARDLVGEDEKNHGWFICEGLAPTVEEIDAAHDRVRAHYTRLVQQADRDWARTGKHEHISDEMRRAAHALHLKREWATNVIEHIDCPGCGETVKANAAFCRHCTTIIDEEAYRRLNFAQQPEAVPTPSHAIPRVLPVDQVGGKPAKRGSDGKFRKAEAAL